MRGTWYLTRDSCEYNEKTGALVAHREPPSKGSVLWGATEGERVIQSASPDRNEILFQLITWDLEAPVLVEGFDPYDYIDKTREDIRLGC